MEDNRYYLGIELEGEERDSIKELQQKISKRFQVYESLSRVAHLTLVEPFENNIAPDVLFEELVTQTRLPKVFSVNATLFGSFMNEIVYLGIESDARLRTMRHQFGDLLNELGIAMQLATEKNYHVTLAYKDVTNKKCGDILSSLTYEPMPVPWVTVNAVSLYVKVDKQWEVVGRIPLREN